MRSYLTGLTVSLMLLFMLNACGNDQPDNLAEEVRSLNEQQEYEQALELLDETSPEQEQIAEQDFESLSASTHLNYAMYLAYEADHVEMTERMPAALRHFRRVLELDPGNEHARENIDLIEGIYRDMEREIPEGVAQ